MHLTTLTTVKAKTRAITFCFLDLSLESSITVCLYICEHGLRVFALNLLTHTYDNTQNSLSELDLMESVLKTFLVVCCVVFAVLQLAIGDPQVPCYFIFGDSLVDNGNNNQLQSLARADYLPYGIDFGGPTGRFSNGKTTVDEIGKCIYHKLYIYLHICYVFFRN